MKIARLIALACALLALAVPPAAHAALSQGQRSVLQQYLFALAHANYQRAFALLSDDERRYFGTPANLESVYATDRLKIDSFSIIESKQAKAGALAIVSERVEFFDYAHQTPGAVTAQVPYGIVKSKDGSLRVADRLHPWRALAPQGLATTISDVRIVVRKMYFFTGRLEVQATFQNLGDRDTTLLPYLRSVLRDASGAVYHPIESRLPALTDKTLFTGLRLAPSAQYTGKMVFATPDRFTPKRLTLTVAPVLTDGADAPFAIDLPTLTLGS